MRIYGYVVMPEHVHLLVSEPERELLADAVHYFKLSFTKSLNNRKDSPQPGPFWEKRYHDRNVSDVHEFSVTLRYLHRNPVKRELVREPVDWEWSSFRHYALREVGVVEIEFGVDRARPGGVEERLASESFPLPRLERFARTWGTERYLVKDRGILVVSFNVLEPCGAGSGEPSAERLLLRQTA